MSMHPMLDETFHPEPKQLLVVAEERLQDARHIWINVLFAAKLGAAELPRLISLTSSLENTDSFTVLRSHID